MGRAQCLRRNEKENYVKKPQGKRSRGRSRRKWEANIKMDFEIWSVTM